MKLKQRTAITTASDIVCWGGNTHGQLGNNSTVTNHVPVDVQSLPSGVTALAAGVGHTCALTSSGGVMCWGLNDYGQLGNTTWVNSHVPVAVVGL